MKEIAQIQYITREDSRLSHAEQARLMFENGVDWVQIRMKEATYLEFLSEAKLAMKYARDNNSTLIINDRIEIAEEIGAHGLHLGLNDMKPTEARSILGDSAIIGGTANTLEQIQKQVSEGVDYIGLGPFRFTHTKKNLSPVIGFEGYRTLLKEWKATGADIPLVAVGGIFLEDIIQLKSIGLHGVAISKALLEAVKSKAFN